MQPTEDRAYGCLFCKTRKEQAVAEHIEKCLPDVRGIAACREKKIKVDGQTQRVTDNFLPGYVFFEAPIEMNTQVFFTSQFMSRGIYYVLTDSNGYWRLRGDDERFARWLFRYDGILQFSSAYRDGDRVKIISGPLKDVEGQIMRVDKHAQRGQIRMVFNHMTITTWLGFEIITGI